MVNERSSYKIFRDGVDESLISSEVINMSEDIRITLQLSKEESQLVKLALDREGNRQVEIDNLDAANFLYELADKIRNLD